MPAARSGLSHYTELGGVQGSIEAAIEHVFKGADGDAAIPKDRGARLALLRRGLIPWLAGVDPETGALRRRVARLSRSPAIPTLDPAPRRATPPRDRRSERYGREYD